MVRHGESGVELEREGVTVTREGQAALERFAVDNRNITLESIKQLDRRVRTAVVNESRDTADGEYFVVNDHHRLSNPQEVGAGRRAPVEYEAVIAGLATV